MKAIRLFSMATLALLMAACSTDEIEQAPQQPAKAEGVIEFTGTITAGNAITRMTMTEGTGTEAGYMNVNWNVHDKLDIYQDDEDCGSATITSVDGETGIATIQGEINNSDFDIDKDCEFLYSTYEGIWDFFNQYGTVTGLGKFDYRLGTGRLVYDSEIGKYVLANNVKMNTTRAIWKLTLTSGSTPLNMNGKDDQLLIYSDGNVIAGAGSNCTVTDNVVYLALPAVENKKISIFYSDGTNTYSFEKDNVTLEAGKYYQSAVSMAAYTGSVRTLTANTGRILLYNGDVLTGTGGAKTQVQVFAGASVTLDNVNITNEDMRWAAITCLGDASITLSGVNALTGGFCASGIYVHNGSTLTIGGTGKLTATGDGSSAGIGSSEIDLFWSGNINIVGGEIVATGGYGAAGIGGGSRIACGYITISGGTVTATGGEGAPGIGCGVVNDEYSGSCENINIIGGTVTAIAGTNAPTAIGIAKAYDSATSTCPQITISDDIISLTMTNGNATDDKVSNYIDATAISVIALGNPTDITGYKSTGADIATTLFTTTGFTSSSYSSSTKTWTIAK